LKDEKPFDPNIKKKLAVVAVIAIIIPTAIGIGYYIVNLPKYSDAIVHGTLVSSYEGSDIRPGFSRPPAWYVNISLDKGTNGNLSVWWDTPCQGPCQPQKLNGIWYYMIIVNCNIYNPGDGVYLRIPIYDGGNVWSEPKAVQGYNYYNVSPHTYDYPALYKPDGIGFSPIGGC
jgi:hypothetical protein